MRETEGLDWDTYKRTCRRLAVSINCCTESCRPCKYLRIEREVNKRTKEVTHNFSCDRYKHFGEGKERQWLQHI